MLRWNEFRPKFTQRCVSHSRTLVLLFGIGCSQQLMAQNSVPLTDLSAFKSPAANWRIAGGVDADLNKANTLITTDGTGILFTQASQGKNTSKVKTKGEDLYTTWEHGDLDLELDYMMAEMSNSGIYLQGRYEIQLHDLFGTAPTAASNGGIYERWDDSRPEGRKGYDGHAPRQNASLAAGLWQHMKISFQAPRFDAGGKKISNAVILKVELNGVTIQENVVLSGPTRGAMENNEVAAGPLRLQGDHGAVAFRNITIQNFNAPKPELAGVNYSIFRGSYQQPPDFKVIKPIATGTAPQLTSNLAGLPDNEFLVRYTGTLAVKAAAKYDFNLHTSGGGGLLKVNDKVITSSRNWDAKGSMELQPGNYPVEILYSKTTDWARPALTLSVKAPTVREFVLSDTNVPADDPTDPILVNATENTVLRSFMDIKGGPRVVHAVSVGSPLEVHYTYDMDHALPVQVWRGEFLNTTPMWHDRGDGSSRPMGMLRILDNKPAMSLARLASPDAPWPADTAGTSYHPRGYFMDTENRPAFSFDIYGTGVQDFFSIPKSANALERKLRLKEPAEDLYLRIIVADSIQEVTSYLYMVNDKAFWVKIEDKGVKPIIRKQNGKVEMIVPVKTDVSYSIMF